MNKHKQRTPISSREVLEDVGTSAEFQEGRQQGWTLQRSFANAALALTELETQASGNRTKEGDRLNVAGHVEQFVVASEELNDAYDRGESGETIRDIKRKIIPFNHALKEMIDNDPMAGFDEVNDFILDVYITTHRGDLAAMTGPARVGHLNIIHRLIRNRLSGMRTEIGAQQLFGHLGYEVDAEVSVEDELRGIDMTLADADGEVYPVDIKSNRREAESARIKDHQKRRLIVWSTVPSHDFDGHFRLPPDVVARKAPHIQAELERELVRTGRR